MRICFFFRRPRNPKSTQDLTPAPQPRSAEPLFTVRAPTGVHAAFQAVPHLFPRTGQSGHDPWRHEIELVAITGSRELQIVTQEVGGEYAYDRSDC